MGISDFLHLVDDFGEASGWEILPRRIDFLSCSLCLDNGLLEK